MRKIYSLVLMAAALLVGTNAWADVVTNVAHVNNISNSTKSGDYSTLQLAFDAVGANDTAVITLLDDVTLPATVYMLPDTAAKPQKIRLEMAGHTITASEKSAFYIFKGHLDVEGTGTISVTRSNGDWQYGTAFYLEGSNKYNDANWTNLTIGENIEVTAVIGVAIFDTNSEYPFYKSDLSYPTGWHTWWRNGTAIPVPAGFCSAETTVANSQQAGCAFGVNVLIKGKVFGSKYGLQVTGHVNQTPACWGDGTHYPKFIVAPTAKISCPADVKGKAAIYGSGYAEWIVEGYVTGATGIFVKSGDVTINNATVESTGQSYSGPDNKNSGLGNCIGSAIVIESNEAYGGNISVTIEGDSHVSAEKGYSVEEKVQTTETEVNALNIESGTFEGGTSGGTIRVDEKTVNAETGVEDNKVVKVTGGTWSDDDAVSLLGDNGFVNTTTNEDGQTVFIVGNTGEGGGSGTSIDWNTDEDINTLTADDYLELTGSAVQSITVGADRSLKYLKMAPGASLTIPSTSSLIVEEIVLNWSTGATPTYATITVNPGGKLIATGNKGVYSPKAENLVLQASATKQALFVISSDVNSNKQPNATVQFTTTAKQSTSSSWIWQRFTTPILATTAPTNNAPADGSNYWNNSGLVTYIDYMDDATTSWQHLSLWKQLRVFGACAITNNMKPGTPDVTYTFKGQLVGNVTDSIKLKDSRWNYFGNSFMSPMGTQNLLAAIYDIPSVDRTIYLWQMENQTYSTINKFIVTVEGIENGNDSIPTMGFFIVKNLSQQAGKFDIKYDNTIFGYATGAASTPIPAPARAMNNINIVRIDIVSESGRQDKVYVADGDDFTSDYETGIDAEKFMVDNSLNIYAAGEGMNYSILATEDMLGTLLSLQTTEDINYTLSFNNVRGEVYALRDNMTNTVVLMNEGATYNFTAQPNATLDGRFQIVSRQEMPTAVETIEETVAPKAIYTVMGQYVGETTDWNSLPAGVYVVDGVKVIK